ncbi:MAG TPA: YggT family protein [Egibacteraceae bacterium]|nr:YggT family protein [Egibacteraceae bacterium]
MDLIRTVLCLVIQIYWVILIVRILLSWVPSPPEPVLPLARGVNALTDPLLRPLRGLLPPVGVGGMGFDLSPILLFIALMILRGVICP